jgi:hypothetical protein
MLLGSDLSPAQKQKLALDLAFKSEIERGFSPKETAMPIRMPVAGLLVVLFIPVCRGSDQPAEIDLLIRQLGSPRFKEREAASKRLEAIGEAVLKPLRAAARTSQDIEVRRRAAHLVRMVGNLRDLVGDYFLGNGFMRFHLRIEDEDRFVFAWMGCPGFNEEAKGTAAVENGWLILSPRARHIPPGFTATPTEYLPVTWGPRTYLLAKDEFLDFCNAINQGREPRSEPDGLFCLRNGDWRESVRGSPKLPGEWASYLLPKPLQAEIVEMVDDRTGRLNIGAKDGVRKGMVFLIGPARRDGIRVISVGKDSCLVREECALIVPGFNKGDAVTSQAAPERKQSEYQPPF